MRQLHDLVHAPLVLGGGVGGEQEDKPALPKFKYFRRKRKES